MQEVHCGRKKDELIHFKKRTSQNWPTNKDNMYQFSVNTRCNLEDLLKAMDNRDGWREKTRKFRAITSTWWSGSITLSTNLASSRVYSSISLSLSLYIYIYIYIYKSVHISQSILVYSYLWVPLCLSLSFFLFSFFLSLSLSLTLSLPNQSYLSIYLSIYHQYFFIYLCTSVGFYLSI